MINIIELFKQILTFITYFNKELSMSSATWSSGDCTITNISRYMLVMFIDNSDNYLIGINYDGTIRAFSVTGTTSFYTQVLYATCNGDTCTLTGAAQLTHTASSNHSASTALSIKKCIGLIPIAQTLF